MSRANPVRFNQPAPKPRKLWISAATVYTPDGYEPDVWIECGTGAWRRIDLHEAKIQGWIHIEEDGPYSIGGCRSNQKIQVTSAKVHLYFKPLTKKEMNNE